MALRAFIASRKTMARTRRRLHEVRKSLTGQPSILGNPVSAGMTALDISAIPEALVTYICNVRLHLILVPPGCRRVLLLIGLRGHR